MIKTYFFDATRKQLLHDVDLLQQDLIQHEDDLLWVDIFDFNEQELGFVAKVFDFHYLAVEDCLQHSPGPRWTLTKTTTFSCSTPCGTRRTATRKSPWNS